ncbi:unnamed protein product [Didymodactylos carnosus]|uniref:PH domain-containing protein n=1 Tax=Didymodactylos carnosus TaxID=1234261 RepID=A0A813P2Y4_9BILA|nr:unnamed protein product [Didymodactylos carnosus]CAF0899228.1 unnamed protein product [Didymodactylos carnosus]CAF3521281.1 unnamed protein product [Didymodactylos carnosus]CAF3680281.1 unnamed protein product [Didymodactylos carnosus]
MSGQRAKDAARHLKDEIVHSLKNTKSHGATGLADPTGQTLSVPANKDRSQSPNRTIATLTSLPTAPQNISSDHSATSSHSDMTTVATPSSSLTTQISTGPPPLVGSNMPNTTTATGILSQQQATMQSTAPATANGKDEMRGWLYKWTNYLKGYQKRWFVLQNGILSYYRSQDEMSHTCRGTVYLDSANISSSDSCHFVISNGSTTMHLRTSNETDKQRWINALELAKTTALKYRKTYNDDSDNDDSSGNENDLDEEKLKLSGGTTALLKETATSQASNTERAEIQTLTKTFESKLNDLKMCMDLINRHYQALHRTLGDLEQMDKTETTVNTIKSVNERATLFRITSTAMLNACQELVQLIQSQGRKWQKAIQFERDARIRMEKMCEQVATQSAKLEKQVQRASRKDKEDIVGGTTMSGGRSTIASLKNLEGKMSRTESDDEEFYDAIDDPQTIGVFRVPMQSNEKTNNILDDDDSSGEDEAESDVDQKNYPMVIVKGPKKDTATPTTPTTTGGTTTEVNQLEISHEQTTHEAQSLSVAPVRSTQPKRKRRDRIPERPNYSINLWGIMKNCVGKDLSKIPIPVNFSEPISMLQRITEELEYSSVLDRAAKATDNWEQLAYVAAFTISAYSTTTTRVNKPFNPLLGETYECDRTDDLGWRSMAEQTGHHPPALSTHAEGQGWTLYQEFTMTSKFRGQYLSITPLGYSHLVFKNTGNHFTWKKVTTLVNNIIVGKLWIDNVGEMDIINHTTKDVCKLKYYPYSYFSKDVPRKVTGVVTDSQQQAKWVLTGTWTEKIEGGPVDTTARHSHSHHMETRNMKLLWQRKMPPAYLEKMYYFTELAIQLNEDEPNVAPTDSRKRPDQRLMEEGRWDEANQEKLRLEDKQRQVRRQREQSGNDDYVSKWFKKKQDDLTQSEMHIFTNEYWDCKAKQDWSRCPDLY